MDWAKLRQLQEGLRAADVRRCQEADAELRRLLQRSGAAGWALELLHGWVTQGQQPDRLDNAVAAYLLGVWRDEAVGMRWADGPCAAADRVGGVRDVLGFLLTAPQGVEPPVSAKAADVYALVATAHAFPAAWPDVPAHALQLMQSPHAAGGVRLVSALCHELSDAGLARRLPPSRRQQLKALLGGAVPDLMHGVLHRVSDPEAGEAAAGLVRLADDAALGAVAEMLVRALEDTTLELLPVCHEMFERQAVPPGSAAAVVFRACVEKVHDALGDDVCTDDMVLPACQTLFEKHLPRLLDAPNAAASLLLRVNARLELAAAGGDPETLEACVAVWEAVADYAETLSEQGASLRGGRDSDDETVLRLKPALMSFVALAVPGASDCCAVLDIEPEVGEDSAWYAGERGRFILAAAKAVGVYAEKVLLDDAGLVRRALRDTLGASRDAELIDVALQVCAALGSELLARGAAAFGFVTELLHLLAPVVQNVHSVAAARAHGVLAAVVPVARKMPPDAQAAFAALASDAGLVVASAKQADRFVVKQAGSMLNACATRELNPLLVTVPSFAQIALSLAASGQAAKGEEWSGYHCAVAKALLSTPREHPNFEKRLGILGSLVATEMQSKDGVARAAEVVQEVCGEVDCTRERRELLWSVLRPHAAGLCSRIDDGDAETEGAAVVLLGSLFRWLPAEVGEEFEAQAVQRLLAIAGQRADPKLLGDLCRLLELLVRPAASPHVAAAVQLARELAPRVEPDSPAADELHTLMQSVMLLHPSAAEAAPELTEIVLGALAADEIPPPATLHTLLTWMHQMERKVKLLTRVLPQPVREGVAVSLVRCRCETTVHPDLLAQTLLFVSGGLAAPQDPALALWAVEAYVAQVLPGDRLPGSVAAAIGELAGAACGTAASFEAALAAVVAAFHAARGH